MKMKIKMKIKIKIKMKINIKIKMKIKMTVKIDMINKIDKIDNELFTQVHPRVLFFSGRKVRLPYFPREMTRN